MKGLIFVLTALFCTNVFAFEQCTPEVQNQIDSILHQISSTQDNIKKVDLEFEIRKISYSYDNCRKDLTERDVASVNSSEVENNDQDISQVDLQAQANLEIDAVLKLK